jgi:hypothetical protein
MVNFKQFLLLSFFSCFSLNHSYAQIEIDTAFNEYFKSMEITKTRPPQNDPEKELMKTRPYHELNGRFMFYMAHIDSNKRYTDSTLIDNDSIYYYAYNNYENLATSLYASLTYYLENVQDDETYEFQRVYKVWDDQSSKREYYKITESNELRRYAEFENHRYEKSYCYKAEYFDSNGSMNSRTTYDLEGVIKTEFENGNVVRIFSSSLEFYLNNYDGFEESWEDLEIIGDEAFNSKQVFFDLNLDEAFAKAQEDWLPVVVYVHAKNYPLKKDRKSWGEERIAKNKLWQHTIPIEMDLDDYNEKTKDAFKDQLDPEKSHLILYTQDTVVVQIQDCEGHIHTLKEFTEMINFYPVQQHFIEKAFKNGTTDFDTLLAYWTHEYRMNQIDLLPFYEHITNNIKEFDFSIPSHVAIFCLTLDDSFEQPYMSKFLALNFEEIKIDKEILELQCFSLCYELEDDLSRKKIEEPMFEERVELIVPLYSFLHGEISVAALAEIIRNREFKRPGRR